MKLKCYSTLVVVWLIVECLSASLASSFEKVPLSFDNNGMFRIVQITDGEGEDVWWGPVQDINSTRVIRNILTQEKPNLVVFTGDVITGNNIIDNATDYWGQAISTLVELNIPWCIVFGNHDDLASGVNGTRQDLMAFDTSHNLSYSQFGPSNISGVSNYLLPIYTPDLKNIATMIYLLDSGDSDCMGVDGWGCVATDQVEWYISQAKLYSSIPSISFFHIPLPEYVSLYDQNSTMGYLNDSEIACPSFNTGLFDAFKTSGDVKLVSVGHNHGNDFCGFYSDIQLCFGRHSGYGGYGDWARGARVFDLFLDDQNEVHIKTWIRYEDGRVDEGPVHEPQPPFLGQCSL
eukprot:TRINITY_DN5865_c0_g1_i2.p1 TRINITY_DN5865_c0_g1~~TRINITY_DN5865_c0_g1_i2.p1  ORF type:complete len:347 (-),score=55.31 TRINITY_DN5865_c0_g1_i2:142-1182(-)